MAANKAAPTPVAATRTRRPDVFWLGLLLLGVFLTYCNTFNAPFIFDDVPGIVENVSIRQLDSALHPPVERGTGVAGRPIVNLTLAVNHAVSGLQPWSYHATNLLIHALATLTLFGVVRRALDGPVLRAQWGAQSVPAAFGIALLWALHPLQTESVTCIIQRTESLVGLFYLLTLYGLARTAAATTPDTRLGWTFASISACALGMGTKEVMVTAPVIALLYDRTFLGGTFRGTGRNRWVHYGLFATWALLFLLLQNNPMRGGTAGYATITWWQYLLTQCRAIVLYLKLVVWPHPLVLDYGTGFARSPTEVLPQALLLVALAGGTIWAAWRRPVLGFLGAWFFIILSPSSSVVPLVTQTMAEHRVYLPLAAILALGVGALARRSAGLVLPACIGLGLIFAGLTLSRNQLYGSPAAVLRDNLARRPENPRPYASLARFADDAGNFPEAVAHYENFLQLKPEDHDLRFNYARDLVKVNRRQDALVQFELLLAERPGDNALRINYGTCLLSLTRVPEAVRQFEFVLRREPQSAQNHFNLAEALMKDGRTQQALDHYQQALTIKPGDGFMHYRLGDALLKAERPAEAVTAYGVAVKLQPDLQAAWMNLGGSLLMTGRPQEAASAYEAALRLTPDDPVALNNLNFARSQSPR